MKQVELMALKPTALTHYLNRNTMYAIPREILSFEEYHTSISFEDIVNSRVEKIKKMDNLVLLWSGGLDSTMIYYALKIRGVKFKILMTDMSPVEYYDLFLEIEKGDIPFEIVSSDKLLGRLKSDKTSTFISGDLGDQVFYSNLTYKFFYENRTIPYRMIVPMDVINYTAPLVNKVLENHVNATIANWCWAIDFIYKWEVLDSFLRDETGANIISFFHDFEFEKYAVTHQKKNSKFDKFSDKKEIRDYILKYGGDREYVCEKTKIGSQRTFFNVERYKKDYNMEFQNEWFT